MVYLLLYASLQSEITLFKEAYKEEEKDQKKGELILFAFFTSM